MPVAWNNAAERAPAGTGAFCHAAGGPPYASARLWPHRSLPARGFAAFIAAFACMILIPVVPLLGTPVFWGLLPFGAGAVLALFYSLQRSYSDGDLVEELTLWSDRVELVRHDPRQPDRSWNANPHWIRVSIRNGTRPVENYLTLSGNGREVELGAFLSPEERLVLEDELRLRLARLAQL
ncbi:putative membrane protein [Palleronia aestuarii]|uniref:Putative membrane protein n=1 Tax=Palleronia aestuarii TaxID=568105 RepID=A0A2W7N552_9RHOB|nr:DUF2244 domain-containing protein [Palleronia aestuarii]PZX15201.1 putative membrane protein [Palleronia aestuarii]